jgi:glycogen operon protein
LAGSHDLFGDDGRHPFASVNFVTAHDGFTLADLVSYDAKHNEANQEASGTDNNRSWNCGAEGPTGDAGIGALRARQRRNFLASLAFSQGVPMLLGGDELGRTQLGNNNPYCQDNELSWHDWALDDERRDLLEFTRRVFALRRAHPVLRRRRWLTGRELSGSGAKDVVWLTPDGRELAESDWANRWARALGMFLNGDEIAGRDAGGRRVVDARLLLLLNAWWETVAFAVPGEPLGGGWRLVLDTNEPGAAARTFAAGERVPLAGRSLALLEAT